MRSLAEVESFGGIDADEDTLLEACFQDHEAYLDAAGHKRYIIVGRKGSGKTAIFQRLIRTRSHNAFSYGHTFTDYPWNHHQLQSSVGVPAEQRYLQSWQYLILLTVAKILLNQDNSQPWDASSSDDLSSLESFVVDSYGSRDPDLTQLFSPAKKLRIAPHLKIPFVELSLDMERLPVSQLPTVFQEVTRNVASSVLRCLNPENDYYVCFDELDRGFNPQDEQYRAMLIGLLLAARAVNKLARDADKKLTVVVFLRDDIYESLKFEDKNKLTEAAVSRIEWDAGTKWTLRDLMERRFGAVLADRERVSWEHVFDESREMTSRQTKYQHIVDRTFRRPRDIIKFTNEILKAYKTHPGSGVGQFDNQDIIAARATYSDYLFRELEDEIHKHLPQYKEYIEVVKGVGSLQFNREEFEEVCSRRRDSFSESIAPVQVLGRLFEFSVVAYQKSGGIGGGSEYIWRYRDPRARFDEAATSFRIHPGFMEVFGLKKFRRGDAAEEAFQE